MFLVLADLVNPGNVSIYAQTSCRFFPETGHQVCNDFLDYWYQHGDLAQQGYPLSDELRETSETDGHDYTIQYFERAVFERHPENRPPFNVLLSLLGTQYFEKKYRQVPTQRPNTSAGSIYHPETKHRLGGVFLSYWRNHGGLLQQGYPISDEFTERSTLDCNYYTVQYFQRAVFEYHPENKAPYDVLLSQLGKFKYQEIHDLPDPAPTWQARLPRPIPTGQPGSLPGECR